jgi:hypothetical protein
MIAFHRVAASLILLGFGATAAHAACIAPKAPTSFPNGAVATLPEMIEAQKAVKQFQADMATYRKCIDEESPPAPTGAALTDEQKKAQDAREKERLQKHNDSVTQETAVADEFNQQIHAYKEAQAAKKDK